MTRDEAIAQGSAYYDTQFPCRYGHPPQRRVCDNRCAECSHGYDDKYKKPQQRQRSAAPIAANVAVSTFLAPITREQLMGRR